MVFDLAEEKRGTVYLEGKLIGYVKSGKALAEEIRKNRRAGILSGEINVLYIKRLNEVHINADRGRARKPYIIVEAGKSKLTQELIERLKTKEVDFNYLIRHGVIEYLDADEEENAYVALTEKEITNRTTHLEIDPASMLGLTMNISVFPEYNSIGRHPVTSNFLKQSQGLYAVNFNRRYDPRAFILYYPQMPIVNSLAYRALNMKMHPTGQNLIVATVNLLRIQHEGRHHTQQGSGGQGPWKERLLQDLHGRGAKISGKPARPFQDTEPDHGRLSGRARVREAQRRRDSRERDGSQGRRT